MTEENSTPEAAPQPSASPIPTTTQKASKFSLPLISAGFLTAALAGYGAVWHKQTTILLAETEKALSQVSKATLKEHGYEIKYGALERAGFPFSAGVKIINPEVKFAGAAFKAVFSESLAANNPNMNKDEVAIAESVLNSWVESVKVDGDVFIYSNVFSRTIGIDLNGTTSGESTINKDTLAWRTSGTSSYLQCSAKLTTSAAFDILKKSLAGASAKDLLPQGKVFEMAQCDMPSHVILTADGKEQIFSSNGTHVSVANALDTVDQLDGRFVLQVSDALTSQRLVNHYAYLSYGLNGGIGYMNIQQPALSGKQNIDLDISYKGTTNAGEVLGRGEPVTLTFNTFRIANDAYSIDWPLKLTTERSENKTHFDIDTDLRMKFTPVHDQIMGYVMRMLPKHPAIIQSELGATFKEMSQKLGGDDKLGDTLASYLPKLSELGDIHITVKSKLDSKTAGANDIGNSNQLTLDTAEIMTDKYGIQMMGSFDVSNFVGSIDIKCINCDAMIDNGIGHMVSVNQFVKSLFPNKVSAAYDTATITRIKNFVHALSVADKDVSTTRVINIKDNGNKDLVINGKTMMEAMMLWIKTFTPESPVNSLQGQKAFNPESMPDVAPPKGIKE